MKPVANLYANLCGHRQMGLRYDDLIPEERQDVQKVRRSFISFHKSLVEKCLADLYMIGDWAIDSERII